MEKKQLEDKIQKDIDRKTLEDDEELSFIEYQENVTHSKEERRNRILLIALSCAVYLLGLGLFATIANTLLEINRIFGIVVLSILSLIYTICFVIVICSIYSKHSFDIDLKRKENHRFSERKNNNVRFEIARNIENQSVVLDYIDKSKAKTFVSAKEDKEVENFNKIMELARKYQTSAPDYRSKDALDMFHYLSIAMKKDGIIYKKANSLIMKRALSTGCLTALSQNAMLDMSIVAVKNMQLIKDLIWLYGFRPTNYEMNRIMFKVIRNVCISIGLNTMNKNTSLLGKLFKKDSSNFLVQIFAEVIDMGAQFLGNGTMTYLIGRYTIKVMLSQYHMQELLHEQTMDEFTIDISEESIQKLNEEIKEEAASLKAVDKPSLENDIPMLEKPKEKDNFLKRFFRLKKETQKK